jgi:thiol-disulfide isomerase/thioredoxin
MKKLARSVLILTLSVVAATLSRPSVASGWSFGPPSRVFSSVSAPSFVAAPSSATLALDEGWLFGVAGYARAVEAQRQLKIPLVVYFYTDWCPYCRTLDSEYLPSAPVQDYLRGVVKVRINPEHGPAEREVANRYGVSGYPSFFVIRHSAARPIKVQPFRRISDWSPTQFADACRAIAPVSRKPTTVRDSGSSNRSPAPGADVITQTTNGGSQIITVRPATPASPRVRPRKRRP